MQPDIAAALLSSLLDMTAADILSRMTGQEAKEIIEATEALHGDVQPTPSDRRPTPVVPTDPRRPRAS
ncbi:hypothetical protein [Saccharothrix luteola]|uniref:hypothetical protein n=1 Tax=Saccharothrix luteola TaxID=2893018 RepID=UPI001E28EEC4|nr:hypothetical protein [Saccharothrix luteola]MCC8246963.1 hypothetical protein [Saccharothrix luteola]